MRKILLTGLCIALSGTFAFAQDINDAIKMYNEAAIALNAKDYVKAFENAKQALEIANTADAEEAAEIKENIEGLIPKIAYSEARELVISKQYNLALPALQRTVEIAELYKDPEVKASAEELIPQVLMSNANILLSAEKYAEAIELYQKVLAATPNEETAYLRIGQAQLKLNNETAAVAALQKANEMGSKDATKLLTTNYLNKAITANSAKKWNDVYANAEKALGYDATNTTAGKLLGNSAIQLKKWDVAIESLEKVVPTEKTPDNTIYNLATAYEAKGDKAKACENYKKIAGNATFKAYAEARIKELCK